MNRIWRIWFGHLGALVLVAIHRLPIRRNRTICSRPPCLTLFNTTHHVFHAQANKSLHWYHARVVPQYTAFPSLTKPDNFVLCPPYETTRTMYTRSRDQIITSAQSTSGSSSLASSAPTILTSRTPHASALSCNALKAGRCATVGATISLPHRR